MMQTQTQPLRLAIVVSHPIQYCVPLYRSLAKRDDLEIKVFFTWHAATCLCCFVVIRTCSMSKGTDYAGNSSVFCSIESIVKWARYSMSESTITITTVHLEFPTRNYSTVRTRSRSIGFQSRTKSLRQRPGCGAISWTSLIQLGFYSMQASSTA